MVSYSEVQSPRTNWHGLMSCNCGDLFEKKKKEKHQVLLPARAVERSAKMVSTGESKLWPLHDAEEQLKAYQLITNSKLHHYRSDKWTCQMC